MAQRILVVDVGGTHLKILASGQHSLRKIASGPKMTAQLMCNWVKKAASGWRYDVAAIGYPGPVVHGRPVHEPYNLAKGWVGFDYAKGLGCPVKVINDAAMQAVGSYQGGRMLFLGLGTGLGSAMIVDGIVEPMELAHLPVSMADAETSTGNVLPSRRRPASSIPAPICLGRGSARYAARCTGCPAWPASGSRISAGSPAGVHAHHRVRDRLKQPGHQAIGEWHGAYPRSTQSTQSER